MKLSSQSINVFSPPSLPTSRYIPHCNRIPTLDQHMRVLQAMFTAGLVETGQDTVTLNGVEASMICSLIDYAYTGQILVTKHNVQNLLSAANLLEVLISSTLV